MPDVKRERAARGATGRDGRSFHWSYVNHGTFSAGLRGYVITRDALQVLRQLFACMYTMSSVKMDWSSFPLVRRFLWYCTDTVS
jgi:hypothetical protein